MGDKGFDLFSTSGSFEIHSHEDRSTEDRSGADIGKLPQEPGNPTENVSESKTRQPEVESTNNPPAVKEANMFVSAGKATGTAVGVPIAVLGKAAGGLIGGTVGLSAGIAGALGAGMGWVASGVMRGNKFERKEAALKGADVAAMSTALGVGALLTPLSIPFKFVENFGKALIPKGSEPEVYKKFDDSYKTNVLPFCMTVGKKAVQEQPGGKDLNLDKTAIFKAHDKIGAMRKDNIAKMDAMKEKDAVKLNANKSALESQPIEQQITHLVNNSHRGTDGGLKKLFENPENRTESLIKQARDKITKEPELFPETIKFLDSLPKPSETAQKQKQEGDDLLSAYEPGSGGGAWTDIPIGDLLDDVGKLESESGELVHINDPEVEPTPEETMRKVDQNIDGILNGLPKRPAAKDAEVEAFVNEGKKPDMIKQNPMLKNEDYKKLGDLVGSLRRKNTKTREKNIYENLENLLDEKKPEKPAEISSKVTVEKKPEVVQEPNAEKVNEASNKEQLEKAAKEKAESDAYQLLGDMLNPVKPQAEKRKVVDEELKPLEELLKEHSAAFPESKPEVPKETQSKTPATKKNIDADIDDLLAGFENTKTQKEPKPLVTKKLGPSTTIKAEYDQLLKDLSPAKKVPGMIGKASTTPADSTKKKQNSDEVMDDLLNDIGSVRIKPKVIKKIEIQGKEFGTVFRNPNGVFTAVLNPDWNKQEVARKGAVLARVLSPRIMNQFYQEVLTLVKDQGIETSYIFDSDKKSYFVLNAEGFVEKAKPEAIDNLLKNGKEVKVT